MKKYGRCEIFCIIDSQFEPNSNDKTLKKGFDNCEPSGMAKNCYE